MCPSRSRVRHRALKVAFAVSWASSVQLAGCLNNPTRADLADSASKAALQAEHEIEQLKRDAAIAASLETPTEAPGKVELAGGDVPDEPTSLQLAGGEDPSGPSSFFRNLLKKRPAKPSDEVDTAKEAKETDSSPAPAKKGGPQVRPGTAEKKSEAVPAQAASKTSAAQSSDLSADNWFKQEFSGEKSPSDTAAKDLATAAKSRPFPANQGVVSSKPVEAPQPANLSHQAPESSADATPARREQPADPAWAVKPQIPGQPATNATAAPAIAAPALTERPIRLRIKALLSEAHTCAIRGELHAAYRSALLAEQLASEHKIAFAPGDENPRDLAKDIAAKIWRSSNAGETAVAIGDGESRPETPGLELASDDSFPGGETFATWVSISPGQAGPALSVQEKRTSAAGNPDRLPEIRPGTKSRGESWQAAVTGGTSENALTTVPEPVPLVPQEVPALVETPKAPEARPQLPGSGGVEFAIAHTVQEDRASAPADPFAAKPTLQPAPFPPAFEVASEMPSGARVTANAERPLLMAPPAAVSVPAPPPALPSQLTWDDLASTAPATPSAEELATAPTSMLNWKIIWGLLGFVAAVASTLAGLFLTRSRNAVPQPAAAAAQPPREEMSESRPLPFKRVA